MRVIAAVLMLFLAYALVKANDERSDRDARETKQWQAQQVTTYHLKGRR